MIWQTYVDDENIVDSGVDREDGNFVENEG